MFVCFFGFCLFLCLFVCFVCFCFFLFLFVYFFFFVFFFLSFLFFSFFLSFFLSFVRSFVCLFVCLSVGFITPFGVTYKKANLQVDFTTSLIMRSWSWQEAEESGCWKHLGGIDEEVYGMVALAV